MGNRPDTRITGSKRRKALLHSLYPGGLSGNPMKQRPAPQPLPRRAFRQPNETKSSTTHDNEGAQTDHFRQPNETKSSTTHDNEGAQTDHFLQPNETKPSTTHDNEGAQTDHFRQPNETKPSTTVYRL